MAKAILAIKAMFPRQRGFIPAARAGSHDSGVMVEEWTADYNRRIEALAAAAPGRGGGAGFSVSASCRG
jgi:hypothetical protein